MPGENDRVRTARAAVGSIAFLVVVPGVVAGVVPWLLTRWRPEEAASVWLPIRIAGLLLVAVGLLALLHSLTRFLVEGLGTPAPVAPTERLVVGGLYRYVRNPMYLAVGAVIVGQALALGRPILFVYALAFALAVALFVRAYEEPTLLRRFGEEYAAYARAVPAWWPRRDPWEPEDGAPAGRTAH